MHDERIPGGTLLGGEDFGYGYGIKGIRAEAIDGFSGECYGTPLLEDLRGGGDGGLRRIGVEIGSIDREPQSFDLHCCVQPSRLSLPRFSLPRRTRSRGAGLSAEIHPASRCTPAKPDRRY